MEVDGGELRLGGDGGMFGGEADCFLLVCVTSLQTLKMFSQKFTDIQQSG